MSESDLKDYKKIFIHFDVKDHHIRYDSHLAALEASNVIIHEINKRLFKDQINCEILILPGESGTFLIKLAICTKFIVIGLGGLGAVLSVTESQAFKGFVKGLTGKEWDNYKIGEDIGLFFRDATKGIFLAEKDKLEKIIPPEINLDKAIKFKSEFYKKCIENEEVKGLGFEDDNNFPIQRSNFLKHVSLEDKIREVPSDFSIIDATIISPVNVDKNYKWKIQNNKNGEVISAYMNDLDFKSRLLSGRSPLKQSSKADVIKILLEQKKHERNGEVENKEKSINTIFDFNDEQIKQVPSNLMEEIAQKSEKKLPMDELWGTENE